MKAATKLKGLAKVVAVDCDEHKDFCQRFDIKGFPTLKVFGVDKSKPPSDYKEARTSAKMVDTIVKLIPNFSKPVKESSFPTFMKKEMPKVLLFTDKPETPVLYRSLSIDFDGHLFLGVVNSQDALVEKFKVTKFPSVVVIPAADETEFVAYDGIISKYS